MFPSTLYLVFYFIFAYFRLGNSFKALDFVTKASKLILYYLFGFLLSSIISLPAILALLNNSRIGAPYDPFLTWDLKVSIGFVISHIAAPFALFTDIPYMFASGFNGHATWYSVYSSSLSLSVFIYYFLFIKDKNKWYFSFLYLSTIFVLFFKPLNSIFHGFSEPTFRFVFLYIFVILLITAYVIDNFKIRNIVKSYFIYLLLILICFLVLLRLGILNYQIYTHHINFIILSLFIGLITSLLVKTRYIYLFIIVELVFNSSVIIYNLNKPYYNFEPGITQKYLDYHTDIDEDIFYRMYIDPKHLLPTNSLNLNQSLNYRYHSTSTYDTNYEGGLSDFLRLNGFDWHIIHINDPEILTLLGTKYYMVYDESELPKSIETSFAYELDFLIVYRANNFESIGFTFNKFRYIENVNEGKDVDWNDELLIYYKDTSRISHIPFTTNRSYFEVTSKNNNSLTGIIDFSESTILYLSIPYNEGWKIIVNGNVTDYFKVHGGFIGIPLNKGISNIEMYFVPKGFKLGMILSALSMFILFSKLVLHRRNRKQIKLVQ